MRARPTSDPDFDRFWLAYPRHEAKADALKAWRQIQPTTETIDAILEALVWQKELPNWKSYHYVPYPATYLRGRRWEDEQPPMMVTDVERARAATYRKQVYGRCPHTPQCQSYRLCLEEIALWLREEGAA